MADLSDILGFQDPYGLEMPKMIHHEIFQTIIDLNTKKAPRPDQIPNEVLKAIARKICSYLKQIFNNSFRLGHYFSYFKESIIVILCKHGKNWNYTNLKSHWPICLLNTLGKIMEAILAIRISYIATMHNLLPKTHFGGQHRSCIKTALHNLLEKIYIV